MTGLVIDFLDLECEVPGYGFDEDFGIFDISD